MKTLYKSAIILALVGGLAVAAQAQVLLGSFQGAGDPLNAGWVNPGTGNPIATDPADSFVAAGVTGYAQSLQVMGTAGSFGSDSLELQFSPAQIQAFNTNSWVTFTFSVPAWTAGGYSQIYNLAFNATGYGYHNHSWATMQTNGATGADSAGNGPNFYFWSGSPLQTQVVTVNYSDVTNAIISGGEGYLQMTFQGNQGGGAPAFIYMNSVVLSQTPFGVASPNSSIIIDQFNPTNNPYAGTNVYAAADNEITNVYNLWTGYGGNDAVDPTNIIWDPTQNCTNTPSSDPNSGAMKFICHFTGSDQFVIWDRGPGNDFTLNPPITNGFGLLTFEFDIKYDPSSQTWINGSVTNFGHFEWGVVPTYNGAAVLGFVEVPVTSTDWVHVTIPLTNLLASDMDLQNITGMFLKQYAGYGGLTGQSIIWFDNLKFTYQNIPPVVPPPKVGIVTGEPGLRIFAGSTANTYDREELTTVDQSQSWINPTAYPVSYSYTLLSYPINYINQTHIFLVPESGAANGMYANEYIEYQASNMLWMVLGPLGDGRVTCTVQWKTNMPNANPTNTVVLFTNSTAIGTWTLTFSNATTGAVTAPNASPVAFSLPSDMAALFANPLVAYFGLQPNSQQGEGEYEDWGSITVTGVAGANENEDFTKEGSDFSGSPLTSPSGQFRSDSSALAAGVVIMRTNSDLYWVNWTLPAANFTLGTKTNLLQTGFWINPTYYSGYGDPDTTANTAPRGAAVQLGGKEWELLPYDDLPTVDGLQYPGSPSSGVGVPAPMAFFLVATNVYSP